MSNAPKAAAGWYPDEENTKRERYWDGERWTDARRPKPLDTTGVVIVTVGVVILILSLAVVLTQW